MGKNKEIAIIFGAGPAGLTTAYELIKNSNIKPIIVEKSEFIGGMCFSKKAEGYIMDVGGHRYFTKFDNVKKWWLQFLPLQTNPKQNNVFLYRNRISRIYFLRKLFDYPVSINFQTIKGLGLVRMIRIFFSYVRYKFFKIKPENSAEDFLINTFGKELYETFFKDYTEKLWGVSCKDISSEWGKERIKGISLKETLLSVIKNILCNKNKEVDLFLYPKFGPGQIWDEVASQIIKEGGEILLNSEVIKITQNKNKIKSITIKTKKDNKVITADYFISSIPIKNLIKMINNVPEKIRNISDGLIYRNFRAAGVLVDRMRILDKNSDKMLYDTWVYIQEKDVFMGRMQIYNNWSPYLLKDKNKVWLGFEYFVGDDDKIWNMTSLEFENLAINEADKIGIIDKNDVLMTISHKFEKAYPAYFGTYNKFEDIKKYVDGFDNLYLIGRAGMHKYINIDHVVLSGIAVVKNIVQKMPNKDNIWNIDTSKFLD